MLDLNERSPLLEVGEEDLDQAAGQQRSGDQHDEDDSVLAEQLPMP